VSANRKRILWLIVGSLTMGAGIWALHFIGMLGVYDANTIHYNIMTLSISLAVTLFASFVTLLIALKIKYKLILYWLFHLATLYRVALY
jgi:NO-binding membrane sensor protein with MHYT domain